MKKNILTGSLILLLFFLVSLFYFQLSKNVKKFEEHARIIDEKCRTVSDNLYRIMIENNEEEEIANKISEEYYKLCVRKELKQL